MKDRFAPVPTLLGQTVKSAWASDNGVNLQIVGRDGIERSLVTEHVIAATGYRTGLDRLPFLDQDIRSRLNTIENAPVLSSNFESSVRGLYFIGAAAAISFGPLMRFAVGSKFAARRVSGHLAKRLVAAGTTGARASSGRFPPTRRPRSRFVGVRAMKILIVATHAWPLTARISIALAQVGFQVATISPAGSFVRKIRAVTIHYTYGTWTARASIVAAIRAWRPDLLVCTDDQAVKHLHDLYAVASTLPDVDSRSLANLIETSLGSPASFPAAAQKSIFMTSASKAGVRCPRTWVIPDDHNEPIVPRVPYPILVKADGTFGGQGVRIVGNEDQARIAIIELTLPTNLPNRIKRHVARAIFKSGIKQRRHRAVCLQDQLIGRPANRAVICYQGRVLAGISVEALETQHENGGRLPSFAPIEHAEMTAIAKTMVEHLQLSGFVGFDFILDAKNNAWLIEMNPRVTPICHLHLTDGTSLPATLFSRMTGQSSAPYPPIVSAETVVLFPGGLWQSNRSCDLSSVYLSSYHDVPWGEPELIRACINNRPSNGFKR